MDYPRGLPCYTTAYGRRAWQAAAGKGPELIIVLGMHLRPGVRQDWLAVSRQQGYPAYAIVLDVPAAVCIERDAGRTRRVGAEVIVNNVRRMAFGLSDLLAEGFVGAWRLGMDVIDQCQVWVVPSLAGRSL